MASRLFEPLRIGAIQVPNRIVVAPMCQYSAHDGCADPDWHTQHWMNLAMSGAGLVMIEATAIDRTGRISHGCLGLYSDASEAAMARGLAAARRVALPGTRFGIQLQHAGRKGSAQRPFEGGKALSAPEDPWTTLAPSALPFAAGWHTPAAIAAADMPALIGRYRDAAVRAARIGLDLVELHAAHGYLLHQFLSPLSNTRQDEYGGTLANRMRFPLAVARAVREALPSGVAFGARITGSDWTDAGIHPAEAVEFANALKGLGADYVCVTSGGIAGGIQIPLSPGYQVPFAAQVRAETGLCTRAVGLITEPEQAEAIVAAGQADCVALARAFLDEPRWGWHAAQRLGAEIAYPPQYDRVRPAQWPGAAVLRRPR
jgi:2,4-dienoyl-CoA reductase-like NADH-dependent reductase (Old Yellow Enzyme family)